VSRSRPPATVSTDDLVRLSRLYPHRVPFNEFTELSLLIRRLARVYDDALELELAKREVPKRKKAAR
jgi:hypothetical protein